MRTRCLFAIILITQLAAIQFAQQPGTPTATPPPITQQRPQQPQTEDVVRITTNLVQVDAAVTDKNGKAVTDLKPEEIQIFEDGKQQKVTHFSYILTESPEAPRPSKPAVADKNAPPPPPTRLRPEDIRRTIALVVDDLGLSFESTYYVRRALKTFVDEQMQPGDLVAIIRTGGGMGALQQFTSDKRQLYAAIERVKWYANGRGGIGAFAPMQPPTPGDMGPDIDKANEELNQFREDLFAVGTLGAVSYVLRGLRELPGRKSILLISDGFRIYNLEDPTRSYLALQRLRRLIDEAGRASVVIYTMNATGLQTMGLLRGEIPVAKTSSASTPAASANGANQGATSANSPAEGAEGVEEGNAEASPAVRHFRRGMQMQYSFLIFNARADKTTNHGQLTTQVRLFRDGKAVFAGKENTFNDADQPDPKRLLASGGIRIGNDLTPGEYVLQVVVNDMLADEKHRTATQWMDFEILK